MSENNMRPDDLTQAEVNLIACAVREQAAEPEEARRLLEHFCNLYDLWNGGKFEKEEQARQFEILLRHLRDSFIIHLKEDRTLESALGLKRKKARPKADPNIRMQMAMEVLRLRLKNLSHQDALVQVSKKFLWGESVIGEAWKEYKQDGVIMLSQERRKASDTYPWTPEEAEKLTKIYKKLNEEIESLLR
jgi:hypothetical protein